jgi:high affinity Mn2+ porin
MILQGHPAFQAPYSGSNSLQSAAEVHDSRVFTLYTGYELTASTESFLQIESAGGQGLGKALGLLGLTNADVIRNPQLGARPYIARLFVRQIIPLTRESVDQERGPFNLHARIPVRRLEIQLGKWALPDMFDVNGVGSDDHLQFMNLTAISNAAWQYAGDSRGFTYALALQFVDRWYAVRVAEALMPTVPNGTEFDWNLHRAHSETLELEIDPQWFPEHFNAIRLLVFSSHSNSGSYREAIDAYLDGQAPGPLIEPTRRQGRPKYGFGVNLEQHFGGGLRAFARFGWSDPRFESYEVNRNFDLGMDVAGFRWHRNADKAGVAWLTHTIGRDVRQYLALGGVGLLLGDGRLRYGREEIVEAYYNAHVWRGLYGAFDIQHVKNPGYNRDRGPLWVAAFRIHLDL